MPHKANEPRRHKIRLLGLDLPVPDHTTFSRRSANLEVASALARTDGPVSVVIDSTGLTVFGTGEWHLEKHGGQARRSWRKFHLAVDPDTGAILASELTTTQDGDASLVGLLLDQITRPIDTVLADGAYDGEPVYRAVAAHTPDAEVIIPPRSTAVPVVEAVQAMRGVAFIVAVTVVAEVGDFSRFDNPRQLMAYLGLVPSEHSSGATVRRGGITKAGNALARRALIEGAWTYRIQARVSRELHDRLESLPQAIRDIAWKAQVRLCARFRRLAATGKARVVVTTAIAREMVGFLWAIARQVQLTPAA